MHVCILEECKALWGSPDRVAIIIYTVESDMNVETDGAWTHTLQLRDTILMHVVEEDDDVRVSEGCELSDAVVVGIEALTQYESCLNCTAKVLVEAGKPGLGRCGKCGRLMRVQSNGRQHLW